MRDTGYGIAYFSFRCDSVKWITFCFGSRGLGPSRAVSSILTPSGLEIETTGMSSLGMDEYSEQLTILPPQFRSFHLKGARRARLYSVLAN